MKITKTNKEVSNYQQEKAKANAGCDVCPCCGTTNIQPYMLPIHVVEERFWKSRAYTVDCYKCDNCGAEWQSDPYDIIK